MGYPLNCLFLAIEQERGVGHHCQPTYLYDINIQGQNTQWTLNPRLHQLPFGECGLGQGIWGANPAVFNVRINDKWFLAVFIIILGQSLFADIGEEERNKNQRRGKINIAHLFSWTQKSLNTGSVTYSDSSASLLTLISGTSSTDSGPLQEIFCSLMCVKI